MTHLTSSMDKYEQSKDGKNKFPGCEKCGLKET